MKIVLATEYPLDPHTIRGGVEAVASVLAPALRERCQVDVVCCSQRVSSVSVTDRDGIRLIFLPSHRRGLIPRALCDIPRIQRKIEELAPDLVHAHTAKYAAAAVRTGLPTVMTLHGPQLIWHGYASYPTAIGRLTGALMTNLRYMAIRTPIAPTPVVRAQALLSSNLLRYALHKLRWLIVVSPHIAEAIRHLTPARILHIANPVADEFFALKDHSQSGRILLVGGITPRKGQLSALKAMAYVRSRRPEAELRFAGREHLRTYREELDRYVAKNDLGSSVKFLGNLDQAALLREYESCTVLVSASTHETFSLGVGQALAAAKPVVATDSGPMRDVISDGVTGFVVAQDDTHTLAERIIQLLQDDDLRKGMGVRGRADAHSRFSPAIVGAQTVRVYEGMLNEDPTRQVTAGEMTP